jgi:hypothetical protein
MMNLPTPDLKVAWVAHGANVQRCPSFDEQCDARDVTDRDISDGLAQLRDINLFPGMKAVRSASRMLGNASVPGAIEILIKPEVRADDRATSLLIYVDTSGPEFVHNYAQAREAQADHMAESFPCPAAARNDKAERDQNRWRTARMLTLVNLFRDVSDAQTC